MLRPTKQCSTLKAAIAVVWLLVLSTQVAVSAAAAQAPNEPAGENLLANGGFEQPLQGDQRFWSRDKQGTAERVDAESHSGQYAVCIKHPGRQDWSFQLGSEVAVRAGEIWELRAWLKAQKSAATLGVILYDAKRKVLNWAYGARQAEPTNKWTQLVCRFVVPRNGAAIVPRIIGNGEAVVWVDDASLRQVGTVDSLRNPCLPERLERENDHIRAVFDCKDGSLHVLDKRTGHYWEQLPADQFVVIDACEDNSTLRLKVLEPVGQQEFSVNIVLEPDKPELLLTIEGKGELAQPIAFPPAFASRKGQFLIMPVNEGISYPVDDETLSPMYYHLYGGHGLCMAWWGITDTKEGLMAIIETPDDAAVRIPRVGGLLHQQPFWLGQKGKWGYPRKIRYVFFAEGGYVAMCKRYRRYAQQIGLFKTLEEKRRVNPNVDLLVGSVNVWCWDRNPVQVCEQLQSVGIKRILWSHRATPEQIRRMNQMGVLTSRYDIYQDVMNPANFPKLYGVHADWPTEAWPDDIMLGPNGDWIRGWRVRGKDGNWYPCGVLCDSLAVEYAKKRVLPELVTHPYRCRFIDTTTASPWRECYNPKHPMTRSDSRFWKMQLLRFMSQECGLVTGSETGHEAAVPYLHYFEGMMSLGPYRVPDAGRNMMKLWFDVPERVAKFQTGPYYRLPLWELVYHECVVSYWYWGDYNNKLPPLWDLRDLWNALYGTPPMFMFNREIWEKYRDRFVKSYKTATPVARATGYTEMLEHRWLTEDHTVQQTRFANGVTVTVNFGEKPFPLADGTMVEPKSAHIVGLAEN